MRPLAALAAALLASAAPFRAEHPQVREGNERLLSGDGPGALDRYDAAEREAGPHPEIDFDRGNALHAQGRHDEARQAWQRALERDPAGALSSRALQNSGNALDAGGDREGAARAFAEALTRDPGNEDARYNLEVLLRRKAAGQGKPKDPGHDGSQPQQGPQQQEQPQQGPQQQEQPQQGQQQGQGQPPPQEQPGPGQDQDERRRAGDQERREQGKRGQAEPGEGGARAGVRPDGLSRQDAERLLDALRARERNMPLGPAGRKDGRRREAGRDW